MAKPGREKKAQKAQAGRSAPDPGKTSARRSFLSSAAIRETIESVALALVVAFLLRTFLLEPFVIPTGSMAPTLLGRHKDVECPKCGYRYTVGSSEELSEEGAPTGIAVIAGTCPMCRFTLDLGPQNALGVRHPSYSGDRILVSKPAYRLGDPRRWDVAVFRYPMRAATDYVKRIVGLPQETLRIQYGDVWFRPRGSHAFAIARKPAPTVLATLQPVYDIEALTVELARQGWPTRWTASEPAGGPGVWSAAEDLKSFHADGSADQTWLAYRHTVPAYEEWAKELGLLPGAPAALEPQLISDFSAYDTGAAWYLGLPGGRPGRAPPPPLPGGLGLAPSPASLGLNWVGDLAVEFQLSAESPAGEIHVELVKGGKSFVCRFDLARGDTRLAIPGVDAVPRSAQGLRAPGTQQVRFANIDQQLLVWLDNRLLEFEGPTTYELPQVDTRVPDRADLRPVRIGARRAAATVSGLKVLRDIYYIAQGAQGRGFFPPLASDLDPRRAGYPYEDLSRESVRRFFSSPEGWEAFGHRLGLTFELGDGQYFMLGDNSAESKDSRLWDGSEFFVGRELLVGRALYVYWPHSWNRIPGTPIPFPFFPNFARMRLVR